VAGKRIFVVPQLPARCYFKLTLSSHRHAMLRPKIASLRSLISKVSAVEKWTAAAALAGIGLLAAFALLASEVYEGDTLAFDRRILLLLRASGNPAISIGPIWLKDAMRDITALGGTSVLTIMVVAASGFLVVSRLWRAAVMVLVSVLSGVLLSNSLKAGFARARPDLVPHDVPVYTASFPSGHAMLSAVVYLTLGALLCRTQSSPAIKAYILSVAVLVTVIVGFSRVYLGVHWPTDVIAGWLLGSVWALVCWVAMLWLQSRGEVEPEYPTTSRC
jgi:undecaprenyl-diphosphatase